MTIAAFAGLCAAWIAAITSPGPDLMQLIRLSARSRRAGILGALGICTGNFLWPVVTMLGLAALIAAMPWILTILYLGGGIFLATMGVGAFRAGLAALRAQRAQGTQPAAPGTHAAPNTQLAAPGTHAAPNTQLAAPGGHAGASGIPERIPQHATRTNAQTTDAQTTDAQPTNIRGYTDYTAWRIGLATNLANPKALLFYGSVFAQFIPVDASWIDRGLVLLMLTVTGLAWFVGFAWLVSTPRWARKIQEWNPVIEIIAGVVFMALGAFLFIEGVLRVMQAL